MPMQPQKPEEFPDPTEALQNELFLPRRRDRRCPTRNRHLHASLLRRTLAHFADLLGEPKAKDLLGETLEEEKAADEKLNSIAMSDVNRQALTDDGQEADEGRGISGGVQGSMRRAAQALGMASDRRGGRGGRSGSARAAKKR